MAVIQFYAEERKNVAKSVILILFFTVLMGGFGYLVDRLFDWGYWATTIFLIIAAIQILVGIFSGPSVVLSSVGAKPIQPEANPEHQQLQNIVNELSISSGLKPVRVYHLPGDQSINAFATGLRKDQASICVTDGLLASLDREATQGVLAHEMSHVHNRDMLYMTLLSAILGAMVIVQVIAFTALRGSFSFSDSDNLGGCLTVLLISLVVGILSSIFSLIGRIVVMAVSRQREYLADAHAVEFTRNPFGLSRALRTIAGGEATVKQANIATAHLFIADPLNRRVNEREGWWANLFSTHPPLYLRIARLEAKAPEQVLQELNG